ncbi:MAG TPA: TIGR03067 domain-containing protein [Gemmataceae bacterium]|nr:TIGR03067 domain-containing protein [Gemmataceae bacterium]
MRRVLCLTLPAIILIAAKPADDAKKDLEKLQGEWFMAELEIDGKPVPADKIDGTTLTVKGDKYIINVKDKKHEVTITLDPSKDPKAIDMAFADSSDAPKIGKGIYKMDGDTFILVRAQATDSERPTSFGTWPNSGCFMVTWKRKAQ